MAHIFLSISLLFLMASDLASAATGLSKPAIIPKFDLDGSLETQLRSVLPQATWNSTNWAPGWVPQACSDAARDNNLQAADFTVINVTYSDCSDPWVLCYHKNSPMTQTDVLNRFGQIPVGMRSYLQNVVAMPTSTTDVAYTVGGYTVIFGTWWHLGTMAHEFTHVLDLLALTAFVSQPGSQPFSDTSLWKTPQNRDLALPTSYASTNWQEDFAEAGRVSLTDMVVSGGLSSINPNASQIANQVATYEKYLQAKIFPSSNQCVSKVASTTPVQVKSTTLDISSDRVDFGEPPAKPDVSLSGQVPEIIVPVEASRWRFVQPLPNH